MSDYIYVRAKDVYVLAASLGRALPRVAHRRWTIDYSAGNVMCVGLSSRKTGRPVRLSRTHRLAARGAIVVALAELRSAATVPGKVLDGIARGLTGSGSLEPVGVVEEIVYRRGGRSYRHRFGGEGPWLVAGSGGSLLLAGDGATWDIERGIVDAPPVSE